MANNQLVNNIDHQHVKVITERSPEYGDNVWYALTFPNEFKSIQVYYPIFFNKDPNTGKFFALALFGFKDKENLFLQKGNWDAGYIPLSIARHPFLIGIQNTVDAGVEQQQRVLHIDLDNPRVNTEKGTPLFLEYGGNSPYLDRAADILESLHHGVQDSSLFIDCLVQNDLLESVIVDITLNDKSKNQMVGFYIINEDKLNALDDDTIAKLHNAGYLQAIYMAIASQGNIRALINKKNLLLNL